MADQARSAVAKALAKKPTTKTLKARVEVKPADWFVQPESIYGGDALHKGNTKNTPLHCTTGFRVKKGSTYGYLTAGHCDLFWSDNSQQGARGATGK